jgi:hypothetical protein
MQNDLDVGLMHYMLSSSYKLHRQRIKTPQPLPVDDLNPEEAIKIANELIEVLSKNNLSYKNAYRISLALTTALAEGGIELYKNEYK